MGADLAGLLEGWCPQGLTIARKSWHLNFQGRVCLNTAAPTSIPDQQKPRNARSSTEQLHTKEPNGDLQPPDTQTHPSSQIHAEMPTMHLGTTQAQTAGGCTLSAEHMCSHLPFVYTPMYILIHTSMPVHQQRTQFHGRG